MGGTSKSTQQTQQQSTTAPWGPTQPALEGILGGINAQTANYTPNAQETNALGMINANAQNLPNYGPQATNLVNTLFGGGPNYAKSVADQTSAYQGALTPYAQGQYLDPTNTPGMQNVLDTIRADVSNSVNGQFAGAGRDLSGANTQALARGISQGEAVPLLDQFRTNQGIQQNAIGNLFNGGLLGATTGSGLYQTGLGNQLTGLATVPSISDAQNLGANSILQANQMQRQLPLGNLGSILNLLLPIAGLGGQSTGTSQTQGTQQLSPTQQIMGLSNAFGNIMGGLKSGWGTGGAF